MLEVECRDFGVGVLGIGASFVGDPLTSAKLDAGVWIDGSTTMSLDRG